MPYLLDQIAKLDFQIDEAYYANGGDDNAVVEKVEVLAHAFHGRARLEHMLLHFVLGVNGVEEGVRFGRYLIRDLGLDYVQIEAELI